MTEPKHTPGPWKYGQSKYDYDAAKKIFVELPLTHQASYFGDGASIFGADGTEIAGNDEYQVFNKPEDVALMLAAPDMYEALEAYEKAEADIVLNANWNTPSGVPQITQEQFDMLIECQTLQARALRKARGEEE